MMYYLIGIIISICFVIILIKCYMTIRDIYNFYYGLNDKHFISITEIIPPNKGSYVDYILELKDNRYFDYLSINFFIYPKDKHQVTRISTLWCDNNSIKHDTKRDFNLGKNKKEKE